MTTIEMVYYNDLITGRYNCLNTDRHVVFKRHSVPGRVVVKYRYLYLYLYLSTILSVLDVLEYLIGENAKYLYLYLYLIQSTW